MKKWIILITLLMGPAVFAAADSEGESKGKGLYAIAAALAIALSAAGGALGQGKIGASAMEGLARNPQAQKNMFTSMVLGLVFIETLVIFSLVMSFMILGKI